MKKTFFLICAIILGMAVGCLADDPETPENETSNAFTDFVEGYGPILYSRGDLLIWANIQANYELQ